MNALCGLLTVAAVIGTGIAGRIAGTPAACRCGHSRGHHQHHRAGTDCALCAETTSPCRRYRRRWWQPKPPAGQEDAAKPPSPRPARPGPALIPPAPTGHPGRVTRLVAIYNCDAEGYCVWVWRDHGRGWALDSPCVPVPTPDQWDWWAQTLEEGA